METTIKKISQEFSQGNFAFVYPYMSSGIEWHIVGASTVKGRDAVIAWCNRMLVEMAGSALNNTAHIEDGNVIAVQGYCNYSKENNEPGRVEYCDVYRFRDEQLETITSYCIEITAR